jgi:NADPH2:quinone reductase
VTVAAAVPFAGHVACGCIAATDPQPTERVLVVGACGGVGSFVIQLAAARGAHVIAAGCARDSGYLRELGAAEVLDYRSDLAADLRKDSPGGIDVLIDTVSGEGEQHVVFDAVGGQVKQGGRIVSTAMIADVGYYLHQGVHAVNLMTDLDPGCPLREVTELVRDGRLRTPRLHLCDLSDAPDTLNRMAAEHTVGKYVIRI